MDWCVENSFDRKNYPDLYWSEAYEYVLSKVKKFDNILAPHSFGDIKITIYSRYNRRITYKYIILHKNYMSRLACPITKNINDYEVIFENPVFKILQLRLIKKYKLDSLFRLNSNPRNLCLSKPNIENHNFCFIHIPNVVELVLYSI